MDMTRTNQEEINRLILETIETEKNELINIAAEYQFVGVNLTNLAILWTHHPSLYLASASLFGVGQT